MAINLSDLPPKYQRQAVEKYMKQQKRRVRSCVRAVRPARGRRGPAPSAAAVQNTDRAAKYRNTPTERVTASGAVLRFDSQKEARRYDHLTLRQQAGEIHDLRLQVDFTLQEAYTDQEGRRVRAIRYRADFTYRERDGRLVVEDVKSKPTRTREYLIKRKLMKERRGIDITEV